MFKKCLKSKDFEQDFKLTGNFGGIGQREKLL